MNDKKDKENSKLKSFIDMTAMEMVPHDFDASKKYPVLFHVYGGPSSQLVSYKFELSWQTFVASQLGFIVVTVSGQVVERVLFTNKFNRSMAEVPVSEVDSTELVSVED